MQLRHSHAVGPVNDDGVGTRYIYPAFDDCGADQQIKSLVIKVLHHPFQFPFWLLAMGNSNRSLRYQCS